jgi:hypothetical protein
MGTTRSRRSGMLRRLAVLAVVGVLALAVVTVGQGRPAEAAWAVTDIASAGPLTHIFIGNNLSCQVAHTGDADYEMFPPGSQQGSCGTFVLVAGTSYGNVWGNTDLTPVSQSAVTGSGTSGSPYQLVTVADAGASGIRITQTDSYVLGNEYYRTDIQVQNMGNAPLDVRIYKGADCYLGGSDAGYGYADPATKTIACTENANNSPSGRVEMWTPITPASHYQEGGYYTVMSNVTNKTELTDTCDCATQEDNGAMIDWNINVGAGSSTTLSSYSAFSPTGAGLPIGTPTVASTATPRSEPTPCIGGIVNSRCPSNPPVVKVTPTLEPTQTEAPAPSATAEPPTAVPPQPTATQPGGGTAGVISGPNTGTGPDGAQLRLGWLLLAAAVLAGGAITSVVAVRAHRR